MSCDVSKLFVVFSLSWNVLYLMKFFSTTSLCIYFFDTECFKHFNAKIKGSASQSLYFFQFRSVASSKFFALRIQPKHCLSFIKIEFSSIHIFKIIFNWPYKLYNFMIIHQKLLIYILPIHIILKQFLADNFKIIHHLLLFSLKVDLPIPCTLNHEILPCRFLSLLEPSLESHLIEHLSRETEVPYYVFLYIGQAWEVRVCDNNIGYLLGDANP